MQVIERILHMLRVKDCRHVCLFCEYYDMCKQETGSRKRRDKRRAYRDQKAEINRIGERVRVTEREICGSFRRAENQKQQIQILTELTCKSKYQIIGILLRNGEKVPKSVENQLYKRLDALDAQIFECEMEYKEIVTALTGENRRKEHGNRIQRHGRTEQEQ